MCGILAASIRIEKKITCDHADLIEETKFLKALNLIKHRGPDATGMYNSKDNCISLGHTRLAIQDLSSAGNQPMFSSDNNLILVYNGEIYNFKELRADLISLGYKFLTETDTEVIICLYQEFGLDAFKKLDGIFALALFDKSKEELTIARDPLGIKPLYFFSNGDVFAVSSEIKAIEQLVGKKTLSFDYASLNRYLTFQWCPGEGTPFNEIKKVQPGQIISVKNGSILFKSDFYKLPIYRSLKKDNFPSLNDIVGPLERKLRSSVHRQMLSDAPVGAFLSGGLDSSSVVAFAKELDPNIQCFSIENTSTSNDGLREDLPYAKKVAKHLGVPLEIVSVTSESLIDGLEKMVWHLDEPLGDPAPLNVLFISELARRQGIKVLLSGAGGDDIFTGYRRHQATILDQFFQKLPNILLTLTERSAKKLNSNVVLFRRLAKFFNGISLDGDLRLVNYFRWIDQNALNLLYSENLKLELNNSIAEEPLLNFLKTADPLTNNLDKMLSMEQRFFTTDHNLVYTDKMSMAAGVEVRVPLLSKELVDFAYTIPNHLKQKGNTGKWIFKKTMEPFLPKNVIYRSKTGFGAPIRQWVKYELKEFIDAHLNWNAIKSRGLFDPQGVKNLIEETRDDKIDASYTIFTLLCVEIWCRQHLDGLNKVI